MTLCSWRAGAQNLPLAIVAFFCLTCIVRGHEGVHYDIKLVSAALAKLPDRADLYVRRGHLYRLNQHLEKSLADLDRAVSLEPANHDALLQRGITLAAMRRDKEAESLFDRVARDRPGEARVWVQRGDLRARTGRKKLAIADYTKSIELSHDVGIYLVRGELQESLGLLDDAAAGYRAGLNYLNGAYLVKLALIRVEIARKRYDQALKLIDKEIARASVKTEWYLWRAQVLTKARKKKEAGQVLQQALAEANRVLSKRSTTLHLLSRARVLRALGNTGAAVRDVELGLTKSPRYQVAIDLLSELKESVSK